MSKLINLQSLFNVLSKEQHYYIFTLERIYKINGREEEN